MYLCDDFPVMFARQHIQTFPSTSLKKIALSTPTRLSQSVIGGDISDSKWGRNIPHHNLRNDISPQPQV